MALGGATPLAMTIVKEASPTDLGPSLVILMYTSFATGGTISRIINSVV